MGLSPLVLADANTCMQINLTNIFPTCSARRKKHPSKSTTTAAILVCPSLAKGCHPTTARRCVGQHRQIDQSLVPHSHPTRHNLPSLFTGACSFSVCARVHVRAYGCAIFSFLLCMYYLCCSYGTAYVYFCRAAHTTGGTICEAPAALKSKGASFLTQW